MSGSSTSVPATGKVEEDDEQMKMINEGNLLMQEMVNGRVNWLRGETCADL